MEQWFDTVVRCYAGYKADERPVSFRLSQGEAYVVRVLKAWKEPGKECFTVQTRNGHVYRLEHRDYDNTWRARKMRKGSPFHRKAWPRPTHLRPVEEDLDP